MKKIIVALAFIVGFSTFGAYPPFAESAFYINSILENKDVVSSLGIMNSIDSITRKGDIFKITANKCVLLVTVRQKSSAEPIPPTPVPQFDLEIGDLTCR